MSENPLDLEEPTSVSPEAPKMKTTGLPEVEDTGPSPYPDIPASDASQFTATNEFEPLTPIQTYEMTQSLLEEAIPDRPLIAPLAPMAVLRAEYEEGSQVFVKQIDWLTAHGSAGIRRTRGDGDCFYRSLAFAYIERLLLAKDPPLAVTSAISVLEASQPLLEAAGFQRMVFEDFYDCFVSVINNILTPEGNGRLLTSASLLEAFNSPEVSNSIVVYLRLLTSAQIRADPDTYSAFLFHPEIGEPMEVRDFCETFVEAVGKEADHVQMTALSRVLKVNISVAYLDGHVRGEEGKVDFVEFNNVEDSVIDSVTLLYRPGHYDILDQRSEEPLDLEDQ
ncbi:cysteine proteinase [Rhodofomes roseus]|uniref:ubiquitinyl hydrolase 1 n=1 Tax=Rhodofomes roseus TaxID=34475 RepID=A0ABQ8KIZ4_9APHY|nr:cysteine proteinase [Rhodofomes roseus]KAH9837790.1 cysteine proteinase [Rhodofomes roseus]